MKQHPITNEKLYELQREIIGLLSSLHRKVSDLSLKVDELTKVMNS